MFVSRRRLCDRKTFPRALAPWALDSGGFSELQIHGRWSIGTAEYVREVRRYQAEIGLMQWAPVMDWMCEPGTIERTGLGVECHQKRTTTSYLELREMAPEVSWTPVLQGWTGDDYLRHWQQYTRFGVDLEALPLVGLGSVCRRQNTQEAERIVRQLQPLQLHAFGFKVTGLSRCADALASADSMAWSVHARRRAPMYPECRHQSCANCLRWALEWRERIMVCIERGMSRPQQLELEWQ